MAAYFIVDVNVTDPVNGDTTGVDPHAPFGGMRASSSHSREQGTAAIEFFTEIKTVQINPAGTS